MIHKHVKSKSQKWYETMIYGFAKILDGLVIVLSFSHFTANFQLASAKWISKRQLKRIKNEKSTRL